MANDGILVVIINVNMKKRELLIKPNITTRGFVLVNENEELIHKIEDKAETIIKSELTNPKTTFQSLKSDITEELYPYINDSICVRCGQCINVCPIKSTIHAQ